MIGKLHFTQIFRFLLLDKFGGLYADTDFVTIKSLKNLKVTNPSKPEDTEVQGVQRKILPDAKVKDIF